MNRRSFFKRAGVLAALAAVPYAGRKTKQHSAVVQDFGSQTLLVEPQDSQRLTELALQRFGTFGSDPHIIAALNHGAEQLGELTTRVPIRDAVNVSLPAWSVMDCNTGYVDHVPFNQYVASPGKVIVGMVFRGDDRDARRTPIPHSTEISG
jgi:hypothetical protein